MDAGKVADVLEERAAAAHDLRGLHEVAACEGVDFSECAHKRCVVARALVAELRAEAAAKTAPFVAVGIAEQTRLHLRALAEVGLVPVHAAVEGAPKLTPTFGKVEGFCVAPGCAKPAVGAVLPCCAEHGGVASDLAGRSA